MAQPGLDQYNLAINITPSDTVDFYGGASSKTTRQVCDALYVGGAGNVAAVLEDGTAIAFNAAVAGFLIPVRAKRVNATGTTATGIVALYQV